MQKRSTLSAALLAVIMIFAAADAGYAAHPLITDDTGTQGKGKFQLEASSEYGEDKAGGIRTRTFQASSTMSYGVTDNADIVLGLPWQYIRVEGFGSSEKNSGISDLVVDAKWRFYEHEGMSLGLKPGLTLPTGEHEKGLGTGNSTYHIFLIGSKEVRPWMFHINAGYIRNENRHNERKDLWHLCAASMVELRKELKLVGNLGIETNPDKNSEIYPAFILGGLIYAAAENLDIDFGIKAGLTKSETDRTILAGLSFRF